MELQELDVPSCLKQRNKDKIHQTKVCKTLLISQQESDPWEMRNTEIKSYDCSGLVKKFLSHGTGRRSPRRDKISVKSRKAKVAQVHRAEDQRRKSWTGNSRDLQRVPFESSAQYPSVHPCGTTTQARERTTMKDEKQTTVRTHTGPGIISIPMDQKGKHIHRILSCRY